MKHASELTPEDRAARLAELKRVPKPEPMPVVNAKDLSPAARAAWLKEHARRFG